MKNIIIALLALQLFSIKAHTQELSRRLERNLRSFDYTAIIDKYEKVKPKSPFVLRLLAESYMRLGKLTESENYYFLLTNTDSVKNSDIYNYIHVLRSNGKYIDSERWAKRYVQTDKNNEYINSILEGGTQFYRMRYDNERFSVFNLKFNTDDQDFGVAFYGKNIVFASTRQNVEPIQRTDNLTGLSFLDLYIGRQVDDGQITLIRSFSDKLNTKFHDGPASFTYDLNTIAFTRNSLKRASGMPVTMEIYFSEKKDQEWQKAIPFKYNSREFSVFHPCLSPDGDTMYFCSNMPGGYGGSDIYKITKDEKGRWGTAQNLGPQINTQGNEVFPSIFENKYLFFATDGRLGLGGLDIFIANLTQDSIKVRNLGVPVNSRADDFALILDYSGQYGYFSSNREGGEGDDDIYGVKVLRSLDDKALVKGVFVDEDKKPLSYPTILVYYNNSLVDSVEGDHLGEFQFEVEKNRNYVVKTEKKGFRETEKELNIRGKDIYSIELIAEKKPSLQLYGIISEAGTHKPIEDVNVIMKNMNNGETFVFSTKRSGSFFLNLNNNLGDKLSYEITIQKEGFLTKKIKYNKLLIFEGITDLHNEVDLTLVKIEKGTDLSEVAGITSIHFDLDDSYITPDIAMELDKIVGVLTANTKIKIEVGCHTDCRYTGSYYRRLTSSRAEVIEQYLKKRVPNPSRISSKGYAASKPLINCECESRINPCSQEDLQINRRTEFLIR